MMLAWNDPLEVKGGWTEPAAEETCDPPEVATWPSTSTEREVVSVQPIAGVGRVWPGTLRYSRDEGIELELLGSLEDPFVAPAAPQCLYGHTTDGKAWSLLDVSPRSTTGEAEGYAIHTFRGGLLVRGAHVGTADELPFDRAELHLVGLRELLRHPEQDALGMKPAGEHSAEMEVNVPGARLTFRLGWEGTTGPLLRHSERTADVIIELDEPLAFDEWFSRWVLPLQDFVSFATREPSKVEGFTALVTTEGEPLWWKPRQPVADEVHRVDFLRQQDPLVGRPRFNYRRVLFYLGELSDPDDVLKRWLDHHARLRPSARFIMTALNSRMYIEHQLANLTSAAEGYQRALHDELPIDPERFDELVAAMLAHCDTRREGEHFRARLRFANSLSQRQRIKWLYNRAKDCVPQLETHVKTDVNGLVDTRNYFTHQDEEPETLLSGSELQLALRRLEVVIHTNFLLDLGLADDRTSEFVQRSYLGEPALL
jgi:hypothetical protein